MQGISDGGGEFVKIVPVMLRNGTGDRESSREVTAIMI